MSDTAAAPHERRRRSSSQPKTPVLLADSIAESIVANGLPPGSRLATEADMVTEYGVGRASLREALRVLEAHGIIEIRAGAGGGPFVARPDVGRLARPLSLLLRMSDVSVREVFDARLIVEPALAGQAARNRQEDQLLSLRTNLDTMARTPRESPEFLALNREFHTLVADAGHNRPLAALWSALSAIADGHEAGVRYRASDMNEVLAAHKKILAAVEQQDEELASRAMHGHLTAALDYVRRYYRHLLDAPIGLVSGLM